MAKVELKINGKQHSFDVEDRTLLVNLIRDHAQLTGTHVGCDTSQCGACTIHMNGVAVKSCTVLAGQANGADITTIEGMAKDDSKQVRTGLVDADFLHAAGVTLIRGRNFEPGEVARGEPLALVGDVAAALWPAGVDPIGKRITVDNMAPNPVPAAPGQLNLYAAAQQHQVTLSPPTTSSWNLVLLLPPHFLHKNLNWFHK